MEAADISMVGNSSVLHVPAIQTVPGTQTDPAMQPMPIAQVAADMQAVSGAQTPLTRTDFATAFSTLVCPQCNSLFGAEVLSFVPQMAPQTAVEADFHRLLPHVSFRGAMVTICPACEYTSWVQDFGMHLFPADMVPTALELEPSIKYAYAIKKGREFKSPALNLALLALNGLWCARQENKATKPWLELTIKELTAALDDNSWRGNRPYYQYLRGEIRRQNCEFEAALRDFEQTVAQMKVPRELIEQQKQLAQAGNSEPAFLPSHMVQQIFCFTPNYGEVDGSDETSEQSVEHLAL